MAMGWKVEWDQVLLERYREEKNGVLAKELCVSERTLRRHAKELGLEKSEAFVRRVAKEASEAAERWVEYRKVALGKGRVLEKAGGMPFEKGHRWSAEIEAKRIKAIRDRAWDERVREIRGMVRRTRWKVKVL